MSATPRWQRAIPPKNGAQRTTAAQPATATPIGGITAGPARMTALKSDGGTGRRGDGEASGRAMSPLTAAGRKNGRRP